MWWSASGLTTTFCAVIYPPHIDVHGGNLKSSFRGTSFSLCIETVLLFCRIAGIATFFNLALPGRTGRTTGSTVCQKFQERWDSDDGYTCNTRKLGRVYLIALVMVCMMINKTTDTSLNTLSGWVSATISSFPHHERLFVRPSGCTHWSSVCLQSSLLLFSPAWTSRRGLRLYNLNAQWVCPGSS